MLSAGLVPMEFFDGDFVFTLRLREVDLLQDEFFHFVGIVLVSKQRRR